MLMMTTRAAKLQTRRGKTKQFKQHDCLSSAGKKRSALSDVTNHVTTKHPAYHKKVNNIIQYFIIYMVIRMLMMSCMICYQYQQIE